MSNYTWIPMFEVITNWLQGYENKQEELVSILKEIGIDNGLTDENEQGEDIPLTEIDPFTFFSFILKFGNENRIILFGKLIERASLNIEVPSDFDGVPSVQAVNAWLFPYSLKRKSDMIPTLWEVFKRAGSNSLDDELISRALAIPNTGFTKLTQCLFYAYPDKYLPIDRQTRPWLVSQGIVHEEESWTSYNHCLNQVKVSSNKAFSEISFLAWQENKRTEIRADTPSYANESSWIDPEVESDLNTIP